MDELESKIQPPDKVPNTLSSQEAARDRALVQRAQAGEVEAFNELVEAYKTRVYGVLYHMLGNREDAADLAQEVFVRAFKFIGSFRWEANFYSWLYRIVINTALNFIKGRKEPTLSLNQWDDQVEGAPVMQELMSQESVHGELDRGEIQEKLNEALQKLSKEHRAVVVLHDIQGMKHQEVARVMGCSVATTRSRLHYAHQQLQTLLAKYL